MTNSTSKPLQSILAQAWGTATLGEQLTLAAVTGWRRHAIITNIPGWLASAEAVEHHHQVRGGGPEEALRQLNGDFGLNSPGAQLSWQRAVGICDLPLADHPARLVRVLALPESFQTRRRTRLWLKFFKVAARAVRHGRRLLLLLSQVVPFCAITVVSIWLDIRNRAGPEPTHMPWLAWPLCSAGDSSRPVPELQSSRTSPPHQPPTAASPCPLPTQSSEQPPSTPSASRAPPSAPTNRPAPEFFVKDLEWPRRRRRRAGRGL